jgi:hypothetical protein
MTPVATPPNNLLGKLTAVLGGSPKLVKADQSKTEHQSAESAGNFNISNSDNRRASSDTWRSNASEYDERPPEADRVFRKRLGNKLSGGGALQPQTDTSE